MRIPDDKIEEVKAAADIVDVVSDYVRLKRAGSSFKGLCPFHDEKSPSFNVNPARGIYKCFGCGEGGDVIAFVERIEGVSFVESIRLLADRLGIDLPEEDAGDERASEAESVLHALRFAARFFYEQLTKTDEGRRRGLAYLKSRGLTAETIKRFGIGYAPDSWDALLKAAEKAQVRVEHMEMAGLVLPRRSGDGHYDRFRGRVVFPIFSHVGKVLGFGGRVVEADSDQPKYINSPETRVYHKGQVLYGLHQAKQTIRGQEEVLLVEGYTDVVSLHQAGVEHVVAASGTALTTDQVRLLSRYAQRVVLLFDADSAGAAAATRSIELVLKEGLAVYVVSLPDGLDPDSFVADVGTGAFLDYVKKQRGSFVDFLVSEGRRSGLLESPEGQMEVAQTVLRAIAQLPREPRFYVMWDGYVRRAAQLLGIPDMHLRRLFPRLVREAERNEQTRSGPQQTPMAPVPRREAAPMRPEEGALIRLMLEHGLSMVEFVLGHMALEEFSEGSVRDTIQALLRDYESGEINSRVYTSGERGADVQRIVTEVLVDRHSPSVNWERQHNIRVPEMDHDPYESAASAMTLLKLDRVGEAIAQRQREHFIAEQAGEDTLHHLETIQALHALRGRIERREYLTHPSAG